jgi:hypothetical protein
LILRTEQDWNKDIEPIAISEGGNTFTFQVQASQPFLYFKPCLVQDREFRWSVGPNKLLLCATRPVQDLSLMDKNSSRPHGESTNLQQ